MYKFQTARGGNYTPKDTSTGPSWSQRPPELPCSFTCGLGSKTLVKFFAALDIVKNIIGAVAFTYLYIILRNQDKAEMREIYASNIDIKDYFSLPEYKQKGFLLLCILLFLLGFGFSVVLYRGAKQENYCKLRVWFLYQLIGLITFTGIHIWMWIHGWLIPERPRKLTGSLFLIGFLNYLWAGYSLYVCYLLMVDISHFSPSIKSRNGNRRMMNKASDQFR